MQRAVITFALLFLTTIAAGAAPQANPVFSVTTTDDDGPGSLRQAILDANALCTGGRCTVNFLIPGPLPGAGYFTIRPKTPLPTINFKGEVNGSSQSALLGIEPNAPLIMLDGSLLSSGNGLWIQSTADVRYLAVGNFPWSGIFLETVPTSRLEFASWIDHDYLGLDPTGHIAAPNDRGVLDTATAGRLDVTNCVIGGNRRSGIVNSSRQAYIAGNRIGVAADSLAPLLNGASGIFLLRAYPEYPNEAGTSIVGNVIANHRDFGVAIHAPVQHSIVISRNSLFNNVANGIDYGLDGPTPNVADDSRRFPNRPTVAAATYLEGKTTRVSIEIETRARPTLFPEYPFDPHYPFFWISTVYVEVYASHAPGQTERYLGLLLFDHLRDDRPTFFEGDLTVQEDLRGQWITAVALRRRSETYIDIPREQWETSESSPAVPVR